MPEIDAAAAYEAVMLELQRQLPELYSQVLAEVGRGRELKASEISRNERASRNRELSSQRLGTLSDSDLAVADLTPEERLMVVVRAIFVATGSYNASVATLGRFAEEHGVERFDFASPDDEGPAEEDFPDGEGDVPPDRASGHGRWFEIRADEAMSVDTEGIDAVLEALEGDDEHP